MRPVANQRFSISPDILAFAAILAALIAGLAYWYLRMARNDAALSAEVRNLNQKANAVSESVIEARTMQLHVRHALNGVARVGDERSKDKWVPALRGIGVSVGEGTELRIIRFFKRPDGRTGKVLNIEGVVTAADSRTEADRFRGHLETELKKHFQDVSPCTFTRLEDPVASPSGANPTTSTTFALEVTFGEAASGAVTKPE